MDSLQCIDSSQPTQIASGLWHWSAPHPEWNPQAAPGSSGDWDPLVSSVLYELLDVVVLIDPLLPSDAREQFLAWLDERIAARPVSILTTIRWHSRDREELAERYRANTRRVWNYLPAGVEPRPLWGTDETLCWLPGVAALVAGDSLIGGADGVLRVCPQSWLDDVRANRAEVAGQLRALLVLPIERVLVSHGESTLRYGHRALARAIEEAAAD